MDGEAVVAVSTAVVALTQLAKWSGVPSRWAPVIVMLHSALGVAIWAVSRDHPGQADWFSYFAGWVAVATSAAGVYGFTRATGGRIVRGSGVGRRDD